MQSFDIVIVGGGISGLVQALALQNSGLSVAVIDGVESPQLPSGAPQLRVSALTVASVNVLKKLGAWEHLDESRISDYRDMSVWDQDSFASIHFSAFQVEHEYLGFIVENQAVRHSLWQQAKLSDDIELFVPSRVNKLVIGQKECFITLGDDKHLSARLVIGADGANSMVKQQVNLAQTFWDYDQQAIVATIKTVLPHDNVARQVFTPSGPLAFLPLWDQHQCSIVWSQDHAIAEALLDLSKEEFDKALTVAFNNTLGLCELNSDRQSYPLKMRYARQWVTDRVALIGDAAHTIHPLAGQGANLGILDAAALAEKIAGLVAQGKDFGLAKNLRPFERWRKTESVKMIVAMEGFKRLFAGSHPAKKLFRDMGLSAFDKLPDAKNTIIKQAAGLAGELPKIAIRK